MSLIEIEILDRQDTIKNINKLKKETVKMSKAEFKKGYSLREITTLEEDKLARYYSNRIHEARETLQLIRRIKIPFLILMLLLVSIVAVKITFNTNTENLSNIGFINESDTVINIHMNSDNKLDYDIKSITINTENQDIKLGNIEWVKSNIDSKNDKYLINDVQHTITKETVLNTFNIKNNYVYIMYSNKENTANKELLVASTKPAELNIDGLNKKYVRFKEKSNPIQVTTTANSYDNTFIMLNENLAGGELSIKSLKSSIIAIESRMLRSNNYNGMTINLADVGKIDLNSLDLVRENPEVSYNNIDDILQIRNSADNITYMYISSINNEYFGCNAEDLIETDKENLYIHYNFDKQGEVGYKTFAIKAGNNLYCIKLNELASEALQNSLFEQLGIDTSSIMIKKIQRVIDN